MKFTVTWSRTAEETLTELWLGSRVASQITAASDRLDRDLTAHPLAIGESRTDDLRIAFHYPIAITFAVDQIDRKVLIVDVWLI